MYVYLVFGVTVLITFWLIIKAAHYSKGFVLVWTLLIIAQSVLGITGFYSDPETMSSQFPILFLPPLVILILLFSTKKGRAFIDRLHLPTLTVLHTIRIPVELVLFWIYEHGSIPRAMTSSA